MSLINKKILITGGFGFIGSNIYKRLKKKNKIVLLGNKKEVKNNSTNKINLENLKKIDFKPEIIFHSAGSGTVNDAQNNKLKSIEDDLNSTKHLMRYCLQLNKKISIVYISSAAVYKSGSKILSPTSIYGKNKLKAEKYLKKNKNKKITIIILRFFSIYGNGLKKQLLWDTCLKIKLKKELNFFGTGNEKRSWVHINDALDIMLLSLKKNNSKILTLDGHGNQIFKNKEIIKKISLFLKIKNKIKFNNKIDSFSPKDQLSKCKKLENWGWKPRISLEEGLKKYTLWFKNLS